MDVMFDSIVEKEFASFVAPFLEELGVVAERAHHEPGANVLHVDLVFPHDADRALRHHVLELLSKFEHESHQAVITSPRFVLAGSDDE